MSMFRSHADAVRYYMPYIEYAPGVSDSDRLAQAKALVDQRIAEGGISIVRTCPAGYALVEGEGRWRQLPPAAAPVGPPGVATLRSGRGGAGHATVTVAPAVLGLLREATVHAQDTDGFGRVSPPQRRLPPAQYAAFKLAIQQLGGAWQTASQSFVFQAAGQCQAFIDLCASGRFVDTKKAAQAFYTPATVADRVVAMARIGRGMSVLEPSVGGGALVDALLRVHGAGYVGRLDCVERDAAAYAGARDRYDAQDFGRLSVVNADFLTWGYDGAYDRVIMNPPFHRGLALAHVTRAFGMLVDGGVLVSVVPGAVAESATWSDRVAAAVTGLRSVVNHGLPDEAFKSSGTTVATMITVLTKLDLGAA